MNEQNKHMKEIDQVLSCAAIITTPNHGVVVVAAAVAAAADDTIGTQAEFSSA